MTVVMPVLDAPGWVERSIAALIAHTPPCYELIVIDNGSREARTRDLLAQLHGVRVVRNEDNIGFGPANNQAAELARGELLLFLNSDAVVGPDWLEPLLRHVEDPAVGAVSPMLLNPNGTLQQAGALLTRDGGTALYGAGDDPQRPEYGFPRAIDYGAGACLLVDRGAFEQVGGFDDLYAPAYFEDADLCLALMATGRRTMYEPRSRVVHAMGASSPGPDAALVAERNRLAFADRWRSVCEARPAVATPDRPWTTLAARDAVASLRVLSLGRSTPIDGQLRSMAENRPDVRLTALSGGCPAGNLAAAGVEVLPVHESGVDAWLATRRFHYDAVLATELSQTVRTALDAHQSQAVILRTADGALPELLKAAGLA